MFLKVSLDTEVPKDSHRSQCLLLFLCICIYYIDSAFLEKSNANPSGFQMTRGNTYTNRGARNPIFRGFEPSEERDESGTLEFSPLWS